MATTAMNKGYTERLKPSFRGVRWLCQTKRKASGLLDDDLLPTKNKTAIKSICARLTVCQTKFPPTKFRVLSPFWRDYGKRSLLAGSAWKRPA